MLWSRWASTRLGPVSLVPHLLSQFSELQEQEENMWSFCASVARHCGISRTDPGYLLNCFPLRLCVVRILCSSVLAGFQGLKNAFWRAAVRICPYFEPTAWLFVCINPFNIFNSSINFCLCEPGFTMACACSRLFIGNTVKFFQLTSNNLESQTKHIRETWAKCCDKVL